MSPPRCISLSWILALFFVVLQPPSAKAQRNVYPQFERHWPLCDATNIPIDAPVVFEFSKPILGLVFPECYFVTWTTKDGETLDYTKFVYTWSTDKKTVSCAFPEGFPAQTEIRWKLNGCLEDLDGLPVLSQIGCWFTTGSRRIPTLFLNAFRLRDHQVKLEFPTHPGIRYTLESTTNPMDESSWRRVWTGTAPGDSLAITNTSQLIAAYYRARYD